MKRLFAARIHGESLPAPLVEFQAEPRLQGQGKASLVAASPPDPAVGTGAGPGEGGRAWQPPGVTAPRSWTGTGPWVSSQQEPAPWGQSPRCVISRARVPGALSLLRWPLTLPAWGGCPAARTQHR